MLIGYYFYITPKSWLATNFNFHFDTRIHPEVMQWIYQPPFNLRMLTSTFRYCTVEVENGLYTIITKNFNSD